jgi:hypothetical protein
VLTLCKLVSDACGLQSLQVIAAAGIQDQERLATRAQVIHTMARKLETHNHLFEGCRDDGYVEFRQQAPCHTYTLELLHQNCVLLVLCAVGEAFPHWSQLLGLRYITETEQRAMSFYADILPGTFFGAASASASLACERTKCSCQRSGHFGGEGIRRHTGGKVGPHLTNHVPVHVTGEVNWRKRAVYHWNSVLGSTPAA